MSLSRLKLINNLREEIESMDVNLARYQIKNESNTFMKKILDQNIEVDQKDDAHKNENSPTGSKV